MQYLGDMLCLNHFHNSVYTPCKKGRFETAQCCYCEFTYTHCCSFDFNFVFIHACCFFVEAIICRLITSYCFIFFQYHCIYTQLFFWQCFHTFLCVSVCFNLTRSKVSTVCSMYYTDARSCSLYTYYCIYNAGQDMHSQSKNPFLPAMQALSCNTIYGKGELSLLVQCSLHQLHAVDQWVQLKGE